MATTMVSPIAREAARMSAATMPEIAAGTTTLSDVVTRRAPSPYDASRSELGTAPVASWNTVRTTLGLIQVRAKKPRTTLGIPARISRIGLTVERVFGFANSARQMALA